jgi:phage I-like protein
MSGIEALCAETEIGTGGTVPETVFLLPSGDIRGRDGRRFRMPDAEAVVRASRQPGLDLPIDYEHQADDPARRKNGPVPAAGWIKDLEARNDGIWGRVDWTRQARDLIAAREYRYLSPVLIHTARDNVVTRLKGASLVHHPNLELKALASQETPMADTPEALGQIAEALGLNAQADLAAILHAIDLRRAPDPRKYVPIAAVSDLLSDRNRQRTAMNEQQAEQKVQKALDQGYITPAMRDWALALCSQDPQSFDSFLSSTSPAFGYLFEKADFPAEPKQPAFTDPSLQALCDQLGVIAADLED